MSCCANRNDGRESADQNGLRRTLQERAFNSPIPVSLSDDDHAWTRQPIGGSGEGKTAFRELEFSGQRALKPHVPANDSRCFIKMFECVDGIRCLDELRDFIHNKLCECENLVREQFQMSEMQLKRRGRDCGLQFSLQGPRSVRLGAIWASDHNVIYFYDARGTRYLKVKLRQRLLPQAA